MFGESGFSKSIFEEVSISFSKKRRDASTLVGTCLCDEKRGDREATSHGRDIDER
jgi:hypothetical protein